MFIRHITNAFRRFSGSPTNTIPEIKRNTTPPVPQGEWQLIVDSNGDLVTDRTPNANDFLARKPVSYLYGGTVPGYDPANYKTFAEKTGAALENAVRDTRNKTLLDKAIFLLSQTDDGRRLLTLAKREKFTFVFDTEYTENEGASGIISYSKKLISLKEGGDAEEVALTAKHELQHLEDFKEAITYSHLHTIKSATMAQRALEANARVSEAVAAIEMYNGSPSGPEHQFKSSSLFSNLFRTAPKIAQAALKGIDAAHPGKLVTVAPSIFESYYSMNSTLDYYDARLARKTFEKLGIAPDKVFDPNNKEYEKIRQYYKTPENYIARAKQELTGIAEDDTWTTNQEELKAKIKILGVPYMQDTKIDLASPELTALSDDSIKTLGEFITKAEAFIPEKIEQLRTNLFAPVRKPVDATLVQNPFATLQKNADTEFKPLKFPDRIDGPLLSDGKTIHAATKEFFEENWEKASSYPSELDRTNMAIWFYNYGAPHNIKGTLSALVDAGLRVPVAALPKEYIMHLCQCTQHLVETGKNAFGNQDLVLMQHWREMADNGFHPVYGTKLDDPKATPMALEKMAGLFHQDSKPYYDAALKSFIDRITPAAKSPSPEIALRT